MRSKEEKRQNTYPHSIVMVSHSNINIEQMQYERKKTEKKLSPRSKEKEILGGMEGFLFWLSTRFLGRRS